MFRPTCTPGGPAIAPADVRLLSTAHTLADARVHRITSALCRAGLTVSVEALGDPRQGPPNASIIGHTTDPRWARGRRALTLPWATRERALIVLDPELYVSALIVRRVRGVRLVIDVHEDYRAVAFDRPWLPRALVPVVRLAAVLLSSIARLADLVVVADDHLPPRSARRRLVVRNLPGREELAAAGEPDAEPRAVYVGDLRPSRGLWAMIDAAGSAGGWQLDLVGELHEASSRDVERYVAERYPGLTVRLHGRLPPSEAWATARGAWVGLCLLEPTPAYVAALPTKVYEYLAVGLPILATPLPRVRSLIAQARAGVCVGTTAEAAATLRRWRDDPTDLDAYRRAATTWADEHLSGPSPFDALAEAVERLISER